VAHEKAESCRTTTIEALASMLDAEEVVVDQHLEAVESCALVRTYSGGRVRVTATGEELLQLDPDEPVIVDSRPENRD
jgi:hypothetical protein